MPLLDDSLVVGQIVGREPSVLNSVSCALYEVRVHSADEVDPAAGLPFEHVIAVLFCTRDSLDRGLWRIIGNGPIHVAEENLPYENLRGSGFVGATIIGSGNINGFLNAYYALQPWDAWYDPNFLDGLLISPDKKPHNLIYSRK